MLHFIREKSDDEIRQLRAANGNSYQMLLFDAILRLVFTPILDLNTVVIPETYRWDEEELRRMPKKFCVIASIETSVRAAKKALVDRGGFTVVEIKGFTDAFSEPLKKCVRDNFEPVCFFFFFVICHQLKKNYSFSSRVLRWSFPRPVSRKTTSA